MFIKRFKEFIKEAYLLGGRAPIYHFTNRILSIIESDELKTSRPARKSHGMEKSISLTRNKNYREYSFYDCLELDVDKLRIDGIRLYPVDEIAWASKEVGKFKSHNLGKAHFPTILKGKRSSH